MTGIPILSTRNGYDVAEVECAKQLSALIAQAEGKE